MTPSGALLAFLIAPLLAYFAAFLPQIVQAGTPLEFIDSHARMFDIWGACRRRIHTLAFGRPGCG
jgi:hypothetical protein